MATDQISFYDESLHKQIEGSFTLDGRTIRVSSVCGTKSVPFSDLGVCLDRNAQVLAAQKMLSELARDPDGKNRDLQRQRDDQQLEPMQRSVQGHSTAVGM